MILPAKKNKSISFRVTELMFRMISSWMISVVSLMQNIDSTRLVQGKFPDFISMEFSNL